MRPGASITARRRLWVQLALVLLLAVAVRPAAAEEERPLSTVSETIDVEQVLLDVVVVDRDGHLVTDLREDEIEVREDGEPVPLSSFSPPGPEAADSAEAGPFARWKRKHRSDGSEDGASKVEIVVFFDNVHLGSGSRDRFIQDLWSQVRDGLPEGTELLVASYGPGLSILTGFTDDPEEIRMGLFRAKQMATYGSEGERHRSQAIRAIAERQRDAVENQHEVPCPVNLASMAMQYAEEAADRTAGALDALRSLVASLGGVEGSKAVLYVADGLPLIPGQPIVEYTIALCDGTGAAAGLENAIDTMGDPKRYEMVDPGALRLDMTHLSIQDGLRRMTDLAAANGVRLYPFQASVGEGAGVAAVAEPGKTETGHSRFEAARNLQDPLTFVAGETGGRAFLNGGPFEDGLETVREQLSGSYTLSYEPPGPRDGRSHRIEVRTTRPHVRILHPSHRESRTVEDEIGDRLLAALQYGVTRPPAEAEIHLAESAATRRLDHVRFRLPVSRVTVPLPDGSRKGTLELFVTARDGAGRSLGVRKQEHDVEIPAGADVPSVDLSIDMGVDLSGYRLAVAVHDRVRGTVWTMAVEPR